MRAFLDEMVASLRGEANADREMRGTAGGGPGARPTPEARGGGRTVQDFRFSRFEIEQKFEEGFDPDRIAVAFASDLASLTDYQRQSGFEPLFGVR